MSTDCIYRNIQKPPFSYIALTAMAIWSSPDRMLPLSKIYKFITDRFSYYRCNTRRLQNSLWHNLSFNVCFVKLPRRPNQLGKGAYLALHPQAFDMFENWSLLRRRKMFKLRNTKHKTIDIRLRRFQKMEDMSRNEFLEEVQYFLPQRSITGAKSSKPSFIIKNIL